MSRERCQWTVAVLAVALALPGAALADKRVRCESHGFRHATCGIPDHGYVRLDRQLSDARCVQGRTWDYNHREIWVDDGCAAEFVVETRSGSAKHEGAKAVAAVAAIALLGAVLSNAEHPQHHQHDDDHGRSGHTSHVPSWLVGDFRGHNDRAGKEVLMTVEKDGRVRAKVDGHRLTGYVNDRRLYVGDAIFELERTGDGFNTVQVGDWNNRVHYRRH